MYFNITKNGMYVRYGHCLIPSER